jgi:glycosyltransferase involved in cell wall biosynthesis
MGRPKREAQINGEAGFKNLASLFYVQAIGCCNGDSTMVEQNGDKPILVKISVIIPAYNESARIGLVLREVKPFADEVLVIDDGSQDNTGEISLQHGAQVIRQENSGYIPSIKNGFKQASGDIMVTLDADGEHNPADIPRLIQPLLEGRADVVLGKRDQIARPSERILSLLTGLRIPVHDTGSGFRALTRQLAQRLSIPGKCICGTSVLEYYQLSARVAEVPISLRTVDKPRSIAWGHLSQFWIVLKLLCQRW